MSTTVTRLLSPNRRRIVTIDEAGEKADPALRINLTHAKWTEYTGPAKVETGHDERGRSDGVRNTVFPGAFNGWIIPGSDSRIDDDRYIITGRRDHDGTV